MREILFRGKRVDNGKWVEGAFLHLRVGRDYICDGSVWIGTLQPYKEEVDAKTVGQYTGLTDKNGTKIFEGDIVEGHCHSQWSHRLQRCVIEYDREGFEARHYVEQGGE